MSMTDQSRLCTELRETWQIGRRGVRGTYSGGLETCGLVTFGSVGCCRQTRECTQQGAYTRVRINLREHLHVPTHSLMWKLHELRWSLQLGGKLDL